MSATASLTGMTAITGSFESALEESSRVLAVHALVLDKGPDRLARRVLFDELDPGIGAQLVQQFEPGAVGHHEVEQDQPDVLVRGEGIPKDEVWDLGGEASDGDLTADLVDQAIRYIADHVADNEKTPWLSWLALGACHAPHQAPFDLIKKYSSARRPDLGIGPEDVALFQYSGGTTGVSKAAVAMHRNVVANRECEAVGFADKFPLGFAIDERPLAQGTDQNVKQS